jgi:hypothetical protein
MGGKDRLQHLQTFTTTLGAPCLADCWPKFSAVNSSLVSYKKKNEVKIRTNLLVNDSEAKALLKKKVGGEEKNFGQQPTNSAVHIKYS